MSEIMEGARAALVSAQKEGKLLVISCENSWPDFGTCFNDRSQASELDFSADDANDLGKAYFPTDVFRCGGRAVLEGDWPQKLWREAEMNRKLEAEPKEGFAVVVTCKLKPELFMSSLFHDGFEQAAVLFWFGVMCIERDFVYVA